MSKSEPLITQAPVKWAFQMPNFDYIHQFDVLSTSVCFIEKS